MTVMIAIGAAIIAAILLIAVLKIAFVPVALRLRDPAQCLF